MVTLNLDSSDCKNAAEMIDIYLPLAIHDFYDAEEMDNIDYIRSMIKVLDELQAAAKGNRDAK